MSHLSCSAVCLALFAALSGCGEEQVPLDVGKDDGAAARSWFVPGTGERIDRFEVGGDRRSPLVDILFVLDPSISMGSVRDKVRAGFASLADDPTVWPDKVRIGVMMAIPTVETDKGRIVHRSVIRGNWSTRYPGTHALVDAQAIASFARPADEFCAEYASTRDASSDTRRFCQRPETWVGWLQPAGGCDSWFRPDDIDGTGTSCLVAHTWIPELHTGVEAGLVTLDELAKDREAAWFRPGAVANVVFVSDTHDPGMPAHHLEKTPARKRLLARSADLEGILQRLSERGTVAGLRLHAIAPATPCVEPWSPLGATYYEAAEMTGGYTVDICTEHDYAPLIRRIAQDGAVPTRGVFPLGSPAAEIVDVTVDGEPAEPSRVHDGRVIEVDVDLSTPHDVDVRYAVEDPAAVRERYGLPPNRRVP